MRTGQVPFTKLSADSQAIHMITLAQHAHQKDLEVIVGGWSGVIAIGIHDHYVRWEGTRGMSTKFITNTHRL